MTQHPPVDELWLDLEEGALPSEEADALRTHLATCAPCSTRYAQLAGAHRASLAAGEALRAASERLAAAPRMSAAELLARAGTAPPRRSPSRRSRWMAGAAFASIAAAAAVALLVVRDARRAPDVAPIVALLEEAGTHGARAGALRGAGESSSDLATLARDLAGQLTAGQLRIRARSGAPCAPGEVRNALVLDAGGDLRAFVWTVDDVTEIHLYRGDGRTAGAWSRDAGGALSRIDAADASALLGPDPCAVLRR